MTADTAIDTADLAELRATLRAKIAKCRSEEGRLDALAGALDRARDQQRGLRSQLSDAESALRAAAREARSRRAYAFVNSDTAEIDLLDSGEAEVLRLRGELDRLEEIEAAISDEIDNVETGLRVLHTKVWQAISDLIVASPEYHALVASHRAAWMKLRSIKVALKVIGAILPLPPRYADEWNISEPLEPRIGYPVDDTPAMWQAALAELERNADAELPAGNGVAAPPNGHLLSRPNGSRNGNHRAPGNGQ